MRKSNNCGDVQTEGAHTVDESGLARDSFPDILLFPARLSCDILRLYN
jgi:hypothetical protein